MLLQLSAYTASAVAPPVKRAVSLWACFSLAGCRNKRLVNDTCVYSMLFTCVYSQLADPAALGIKHDSQLSNQSASASCLLKEICPPSTPWITQCGDSCCEALHSWIPLQGLQQQLCCFSFLPTLLQPLHHQSKEQSRCGLALV